jgi:hypothetical protein
VQLVSNLDQAVNKSCECISDIKALRNEIKAIKEAEENEKKKKLSDSVHGNLLL